MIKPRPIYGNETRVEHIIYPLPLKYGDRFGADIRTGRRKRKKARGEGKEEKEGWEVLRRPEVDGGRLIAAGCASSFFDQSLAY